MSPLLRDCIEAWASVVLVIAIVLIGYLVAGLAQELSGYWRRRP